MVFAKSQDGVALDDVARVLQTMFFEASIGEDWQRQEIVVEREK